MVAKPNLLRSDEGRLLFVRRPSLAQRLLDWTLPILGLLALAALVAGFVWT